jgi:uncharacterized protein YciI
MKWFLVIRRMTRPVTDWQDRVPDHLAWLRDQHENGRILISGPSADLTTGLYVMRAPSEQDAANTAAGDPLAQDGLATVEIIDWQVHQILGVGPFDPDAIPEA